MPSSAFSRARKIATPSTATSGVAYAIIAGLFVPIIILILGVATLLVETRGLKVSPVVLGRYLAIPIPQLILQMEPLRQLILVGTLGGIAALFQVLALWMSYRRLFSRSQEIVTALHRDTLNRCIEHATTEGVTAQRRRAEQLIQTALPEVRAGLIRWHRTHPRGLVMLIGCVLLAIAVDVWLALLAVVSWLLIWRFYRWLEGLDEPEGSDWELPRARARLVEMVQEAPMLARLRSGEDFDSLYTSQLQRVMELQGDGDKETVRHIPALALAVVAACVLLLFAMGINLLDPRSELNLPAAFVLASAIVGAGIAAAKIARTQRAIRVADDAAMSVFAFLDQPTPTGASERLGIGGLNDAIELSHVTLRDGQQQVLANDVSLRLEPRTLVALLGTDATALRALVEMLLGFGRPESGKVTLDGMSIADIHPTALGKQVVWVGHDGPIWPGTIEDNLRANIEGVTTADLADVTRRVGLYDRIQQFEDGFAAQISPGDSRLEAKGCYALAVARALLAQPAVVIVEELPLDQAELPDDPCLDALKALVQQGSLVVMLPRRLQSLRAADRVILLSKGQIAGEGKHQELLSTSDLYRHLNYQLFNPYRDVS